MRFKPRKHDMTFSRAMVLIKASGVITSRVNANSEYRVLTMWDITNDRIVETYVDDNMRNIKNWSFIDNYNDMDYTVYMEGEFKFKKTLTTNGMPNLDADCDITGNKLLSFDQTYNLCEHRNTISDLDYNKYQNICQGHDVTGTYNAHN
tara:strand:+ start:2888 stop:3334 length:447 start_codon:yes stop_codon:yes gene_type:complete